MTRGDNREVIAELFDRLHAEFGGMAPNIIKIMVMVLGKTRVTFPDVDYLYRQERNRRIRIEFKGANHEELAIKYKLKSRQIRRILLKEEA